MFDKEYEYIMTKKEIMVEGERYIVYGVKVSGHQKIALCDDISTDKNKVQKFIDNIRRSKIPPEQLHDVVEDFIFEQDCDYVILQKDY